MPIARTNDDVALSYKTNGSGRCHLLFVHDWAGSSAHFDEVMRHLDFTNLRTVTYDMRGHGSSGKPEFGYTLQRFAQDVFDVLDHAGAAKAIVIGFGLGAKIAQYATILHPERVRGLILIAGCPASPLQLSVEMQQDWINRAQNLEQLLELKQTQITRFVAPNVLERWGQEAVKITRDVLENMLYMMTETSFKDRLWAINCSVLVIGGSHDLVFSSDLLRNDVAVPLGNARLALLDSSHEIPLEQPLELASLILAFLAGVNAVPMVRKIDDTSQYSV